MPQNANQDKQKFSILALNEGNNPEKVFFFFVLS